jgi:non-ribosomal peptide synthetase component E (peptide arylation enzyme)
LFAGAVEEWSDREPERPALISETETFSYRALADRINRYARWALSAGIEAGDTVCRRPSVRLEEMLKFVPDVRHANKSVAQ